MLLCLQSECVHNIIFADELHVFADDVFADDVFSHHFYGYNNYQHSYTHATMQLL